MNAPLYQAMSVTDPLSRLTAAIADRYRIERELGRGGMATVYLAQDRKLDRRVAIKVLKPELAAAIGSERFLREIKLTARLEHPHILSLHDSGEADGLLYYVMPYIEGESLRERLAREGELPISDAVRVLREVVDALAHAHQAGVVHRDIKPDNVLLSGRHAVVTDFGVAKAVSEAAGSQKITTAGVALGTPTYMAPEQAAASPHVDHRADIYAVGVLAYELLAGRTPFPDGSPAAVLTAHMTQAPEDVAQHRATISPALARVVMKCLEKKPADRWQSSRELLAELDTLATPSGGITPTDTRPVTATSPRTRRIAFGALGVLAVGAVAVGLLMRAPSAAPLNRDVLAVAPFDILASDDLELWREGLVDILSRNLDGAGPLKTVSPTVGIRRWEGRADPASAGALGRATGAGLAVFGQLVATGQDSVRLRASLLDVVEDAVIGEVEVRGATDRMDRLADTLTVALLRELGRTRPIGAVRYTSFASPSLAAMKYFLQGEQQYRRSNWDSARVNYQRAVELDTTFALAFSRLGTVVGWEAHMYDSLAESYSLRAGQLNHGLPPRESLLVAMDSVLNAVSALPPGGFDFVALVRRLFSITENTLQRYPNDPQVWYAVGEARTHAGLFVGLPQESALQAFNHAIALDSAFAPAYIHPVELGLSLEGPEAARQYIDAYLALDPTDKHAAGERLVRRLLDPATAFAEETQQALDTASASTLSPALLAFWDYPDSTEWGLTVARLLAEGRPGYPPWNDPETGRSFEVAYAARRGHLGEAAGLLSPDDDYDSVEDLGFMDLAQLGAVPPDSVRARVLRFIRTGTLWGPLWLWWLGQQGDTAAIYELLASTRDRGAWGGALDPYLEPAAQAYLALVRGDSAAALARFLALPDSLCPLCVRDHLTRIRLLTAAGRDAEAVQQLDADAGIVSWSMGAVRVVWALERARVNDRLGNTAEAVDAYAFVADVWRHADPELQPLVEEARRALARLRGEPL